MKEALIALSGTVIGFLLGWLKEIIQARSKLEIALKDGSLAYYKQQQNSFGEVVKEKAVPEIATNFMLNLKFDVFNIGKLGTGVTDIFICIEDNSKKLYFQPQLKLPFENKKLENISFNIEPSKVYTLDASLFLENTQENSYIFGNVNLEPDCNNSLKINIIVKSIKNKNVVCNVEPISIYIA